MSHGDRLTEFAPERRAACTHPFASRVTGVYMGGRTHAHRRVRVGGPQGKEFVKPAGELGVTVE